MGQGGLRGWVRGRRRGRSDSVRRLVLLQNGCHLVHPHSRLFDRLREHRAFGSTARHMLADCPVYQMHEALSPVELCE